MADKENLCAGCQEDAGGAGACTCEVQQTSAIVAALFLLECFSGAVGIALGCTFLVFPSPELLIWAAALDAAFFLNPALI